MGKLLYDPVIKICVILIMHGVRRRVNFSQALLILAFCSLWGLEFLTYIIFFNSFVDSSDCHYIGEGKKKTSYMPYHCCYGPCLVRKNSYI